jgi:hypothetical protein
VDARPSRLAVDCDKVTFARLRQRRKRIAAHAGTEATRFGVQRTSESEAAAKNVRRPEEAAGHEGLSHEPQKRAERGLVQPF